MYVSIGRNEFAEDNDNKYLYFINVENYRYAWKAMIIKQGGIVRCVYKFLLRKKKKL